MLFTVEESEEMFNMNSTLCSRNAVIKVGALCQIIGKALPTEAAYSVSFR